MGKKIKNDDRQKTENVEIPQKFIVQASKVQKIVLNIMSVVYGLLMVWALASGIVLHGAIGVVASFVIVALFAVSQYTEKYIIDNGYIIVKKALARNKVVAFSDIDRAEYEQGNKTTFISIYKKGVKKPILRVETSFTNIEHLNALAWENGWFDINKVMEQIT